MQTVALIPSFAAACTLSSAAVDTLSGEMVVFVVRSRCLIEGRQGVLKNLTSGTQEIISPLVPPYPHSER